MLQVARQAFSVIAGVLNQTHLYSDSDLFLIGVDYHANKMISPYKHMFKDLKAILGIYCEGFNDRGWGATLEGVGTFILQLEDDDGGIHVIEIPNSLYIP